MKVVNAGGSAFLGRELADHFKEEHEVVIFTRGASKVLDNIKFVQWYGRTIGDQTNEMEGAELLINLTGKSVDCRYTDENKKEIIRLKVESTHILGEVVETLKNIPYFAGSQNLVWLEKWEPEIMLFMDSYRRPSQSNRPYH